MTLGLQLDIRDGATPALRARLDALKLPAMQTEVGVAVRDLTQDHLRELDDQGNRLGGAHTGYYGKQAAATRYDAIPGGVTLAIGEENRGMALHYFGGDLGPEDLHNAKNFSVPARAEAHGKVPGDFGGQLEVLWGRNGPYALARHLEAPRAKKRGTGTVKDTRPGEGRGEVLFWLTKHIHFDADHSIIPTLEQYRAAGISALERLWRITSGGAS